MKLQLASEYEAAIDWVSSTTQQSIAAEALSLGIRVQPVPLMTERNLNGCASALVGPASNRIVALNTI